VSVWPRPCRGRVPWTVDPGSGVAMDDGPALRRARAAAAQTTLSPSPPPPQLELPSPRTRTRLFRQMDASGNGTLSMSEVGTAVTQLYPDFGDHKAIRQAFRAADEDGSAAIGQEEFGRFMGCVAAATCSHHRTTRPACRAAPPCWSCCSGDVGAVPGRYLGFFAGAASKFDKIDADGDGRLALGEFGAAAALVLGLELGEDEAAAEFERVDADGGGYASFDEFCSWCARRWLAPPAPAEGSAEEEEEEEEGERHSVFVYGATRPAELARMAGRSRRRRGGGAPPLASHAAVAPDFQRGG
jgi:Ca2+-binding EF-hand superfamily protein